MMSASLCHLTAVTWLLQRPWTLPKLLLFNIDICTDLIGHQRMLCKRFTMRWYTWDNEGNWLAWGKSWSESCALGSVNYTAKSVLDDPLMTLLLAQLLWDLGMSILFASCRAYIYWVCSYRYPPSTADTITKSIMVILHQHTSSLHLQIIACAISSLIASFRDEDLHQFLNVQLDILSISSQAKQAIIPALCGIARLTGAQSWGWDRERPLLTISILSAFVSSPAHPCCSQGLRQCLKCCPLML